MILGVVLSSGVHGSGGGRSEERKGVAGDARDRRGGGARGGVGRYSEREAAQASAS